MERVGGVGAQELTRGNPNKYFIAHGRQHELFQSPGFELNSSSTVQQLHDTLGWIRALSFSLFICKMPSALLVLDIQ